MTANANQIALSIQFKIKPGRKEAFRDALVTLVDIMSKEPSFVNAIISDDVDHPDELHLYEIWKGTKNSWLEEELPKPYRRVYDETVGDMLEEKILNWLTPVAEWGSQLTNVSR